MHLSCRRAFPRVRIGRKSSGLAPIFLHSNSRVALRVVAAERGRHGGAKKKQRARYSAARASEQESVLAAGCSRKDLASAFGRGTGARQAASNFACV